MEKTLPWESLNWEGLYKADIFKKRKEKRNFMLTGMDVATGGGSFPPQCPVKGDTQTGF